jgi:hypothetical protein
MRRKLSLLVLTVGLTLAIAAPSQAASTASPSSLDFGTFAVNAVPTSQLTSTITGGAEHPYFAGVRMIAGQSYFYPSTYCPEATKNFPPCPVNVRVAYPMTGMGALTGIVGVDFTDEGFSEHPKINETIEIQVKANVTAASITPPVLPPTVVPPTVTPPATGGGKPKKKACKKSGAGKKGKSCGAKKKGHKGKGKSKGR